MSMGIYIKGMEMPKSCERCPMLDWDLDYIKCKVTDRHFKMTECWRAIRVPDCPLVPVPPHGRLIEKDAVFELIRSFPSVDRQLPVEFMKALYELPIIIEAEEEKHGRD